MADADVIIVIGANPTEGHPVFASQMKRRLREGAKLVVCDPRRIDLVRTPHIEAVPSPGTATRHERAADERLRPCRGDRRPRSTTTSSTNVATSESFRDWLEFARDRANAPETVADVLGVPAADLRAAARLYATARNAAIYYGLGVTEHSQGSTMVMAMANIAMATGNIGRPGVGVNPLRGQNNVQGSCDVGSFPHEFSGYRPVADDTVRAEFSAHWNIDLDPGAGPPDSEHARRGLRRHLQGHLHPRRGHRPIRSRTPSMSRRRSASMECVDRPGSVPERDRQVRPRLPAGFVVPREGRHLRERRTAHQPGTSRDAVQGGDAGVAGHPGARQCHGLPDELRRRWRRSSRKSPSSPRSSPASPSTC